MAKNIYFHVYCSRAVKPFTPDELQDLLTRSRANNSQAGLTGLLLYKAGNFMQVLEGSELAIRPLLKKIHQDPRHTNVFKILDGFTDERQFPFWYMGFENLDSESIKAAAAYFKRDR